MFVSFLQIKRAYKAHYKTEMPGDLPYTKAAEQLVKELGERKAIELMKSQSNEVQDVES